VTASVLTLRCCLEMFIKAKQMFMEWIKMQRQIQMKKVIEQRIQEGGWQQSSGKLEKIEIKTGRYSAKLLYLSFYSQSQVFNFTFFTLLFHFLSPHFSFIFPFCSLLHSILSSSLCPHLYQPHSCLLVLVYLSDPKWQWIYSLAMSCLPSGAAAVLGQEEERYLFSKILLYLLPLFMTIQSQVLMKQLRACFHVAYTEAA